MSEFNQVHDFEKIIFDDKLVDPEDEKIIRSMKVRLLWNKRIFTLFIRMQSSYPA